MYAKANQNEEVNVLQRAILYTQHTDNKSIAFNNQFDPWPQTGRRQDQFHQGRLG